MTIIKKFDTDQNAEKNYSKKYFVVVGAALLMLVIFELWINNTMVLYGEKYEDISKLEKALKMENQILENKIAKELSLDKLASKSAELGFTKSESIQYIR